LTVREYARIQTFPDDWTFSVSMTSQYKQIGNAVPANPAQAIASSVARFLDGLPAKLFSEEADLREQPYSLSCY
jgi:DNA (cytosine-5)-methyltransferase 1